MLWHTLDEPPPVSFVVSPSCSAWRACSAGTPRARTDAATAGVGLVDDAGNGVFETVPVMPTNRVAVFVGKTAAECD